MDIRSHKLKAVFADYNQALDDYKDAHHGLMHPQKYEPPIETAVDALCVDVKADQLIFPDDKDERLIAKIEAAYAALGRMVQAIDEYRAMETTGPQLATMRVTCADDPKNVIIINSEDFDPDYHKAAK